MELGSIANGGGGSGGGGGGGGSTPCNTECDIAYYVCIAGCGILGTSTFGLGGAIGCYLCYCSYCHGWCPDKICKGNIALPGGGYAPYPTLIYPCD